MALKISFSNGETREVSDAELAGIAERLRGLVPESSARRRVRGMINDGLELRRLGDELESSLREDERVSLEDSFYSLANKIRRETQELSIQKGRRLEYYRILDPHAETAQPPFNPELAISRREYSSSDGSSPWTLGTLEREPLVRRDRVSRESETDPHRSVRGRSGSDSGSVSNDW